MTHNVHSQYLPMLSYHSSADTPSSTRSHGLPELLDKTNRPEKVTTFERNMFFGCLGLHETRTNVEDSIVEGYTYIGQVIRFFKIELIVILRCRRVGGLLTAVAILSIIVSHNT